MKSFTISSLGSPPEFTKSTTDENYWTERAHCEQSQNTYNAQQEGFGIYEVENSDITLLDAWMASATDAIEEYGEDIVAWMRGDEAEEKPAKPEMPTLPEYAFVFEQQTADFCAKWNLAVLQLSVAVESRLIGVSAIRLLDQIKDQENILHFDNYQLWVKAACIDSDPNNP
jgi:hypothetical protein